MPRLPDIHHNITARASAFHVNKNRRNRADVEYGHKKRRDPIDRLGKRSVAFEDARHFGNP